MAQQGRPANENFTRSQARQSTLQTMSFLDRALRMGEAKKFKSYEQRVGRINGYEPEMESSTDAELLEVFEELRERARGGESLDDLLPRPSRWSARRAGARSGCATSMSS